MSACGKQGQSSLASTNCFLTWPRQFWLLRRFLNHKKIGLDFRLCWGFVKGQKSGNLKWNGGTVESKPHVTSGKTTSARIIKFLEHQTANQQGDVNPSQQLKVPCAQSVAFNPFTCTQGSITILTLLSAWHSNDCLAVVPTGYWCFRKTASLRSLWRICWHTNWARST